MQLRSVYCLLLAGVFIGGNAFTQTASPTHDSRWSILVERGKGEYRGRAVCHPLEYFSGSPFLFDYDNELFGMKPGDVHVQTQVTFLGVVDRRKIVQIEQSINAGDLVMKRLLVQRHGDEFCAVYQQQFPAALVQVSPARVETVDGQPVMITRDPNGNREYNEAYWTFDAEGPIPLDLSAIDHALKALLPSGDEVRGDYGLDVGRLCYSSVVWKKGECNACASGGSVVLKLALEHHRLVVTRKLFDASGAADASACAQ
jgi:hypothetical protein